MKTISLAEINRPSYDLYTEGEFEGNHRDLLITRRREGDIITESTSWVRDTAGHFMNRKESSFSVSELAAEASELGLELVDDIPQGFSLVA
jgi:hypothetical protein